MPFLFTHRNRNVIARETASYAHLLSDAPSQQDVIDVTYQPNKQTEAKGKDSGKGMFERRQGGPRFAAQDRTGNLGRKGTCARGRSLIHEPRGDQFVEEKLDVCQLRVTDAERTQQADVPALDGHEDAAKVLQVGAHQV